MPMMGGKAFSSVHQALNHARADRAEKMKGLEPKGEQKMEGEKKDAKSVVAEHGKAHEIHIKHDHEAGHHTVHAKHGDGHTHSSEHASAEEAHNHAAELAGVEPGGEPVGGEAEMAEAGAEGGEGLGSMGYESA